MRIRRGRGMLGVALLAMASVSYGVTYTWTGAVDGNWSNAANWDAEGMPVDNYPTTAGLEMPYTDLIVFDGEIAPTENVPGIGGEYDDTATILYDTPRMQFNSGGAFDFIMTGNAGAVWMNTACTTTVFNVGDDIGGSGDVTVTVTNMNSMSRHADNVFNNFQVNSDGVLVFEDDVNFIYQTRKATRNSKFTVNGGELVVNGALVNLGELDTHVDFIAPDGRLTAQYGGPFADITAVRTSAAWRNNGGPSTVLEFTDNGDGFTVEALYSPVIAAINVSTNRGTAPLEVTFYATNSLGAIASYEWDFGDGETGSGSTVAHTYAEVGSYIATLTVSDGEGNSNSTVVTLSAYDSSKIFDLIAVEEVPPTSLAYYETSITNLLTDPFIYHPSTPTAYSPSLLYSDGFHGEDQAGLDVYCCFTLPEAYSTVETMPVIIMDMWGRNSHTWRDDDIDVILYNGSFDDGDIVGSVEGAAVGADSYGRAVINTLAVGTTFDRVQIVGHNTSGTVKNSFTLTEVRLAAVAGEIQLVTARVSADPVSGYYPLEVAFDGTRSFATGGTIDEYLWDFGDGNAASGQDTAVNTYAEVGSFTNTLTVIGNGETNSAEVVIETINPIYAAITASTNTASVGYSIDFDASGSTNAVDAALVSYEWDFGDETSASGESVSKVYLSGGTKTVVLTVTDEEGRVNRATVDLEISGAPELSLVDGVLSWDTEASVSYDIQYNDDLVTGTWTTYTNVTATSTTTSVALPLGRTDAECFRVLRNL